MYSSIIKAAAAALLLFVLLPGCSGDDCPTCPTPGTGAASLSFNLMHPQPAPFYYNSVWAAGADYIFVTTGTGTVLRRTGSVWTSYDTGGPAPLMDLWGSSASDVFAVGRNGVIRHFDGSRWTTMPTGSFYDLEAVWGAAPDTVYATSNRGVLFGYDGTAWSPVNTGLATANRSLRDISGSSGSDVWTVGVDRNTAGGGLFQHWDGSNWVEGVIGQEVTAIWSYGPGLAVCTDTESQIIWCDFPMLTFTGQYLDHRVTSLWASSSNDIWAGGHDYDPVTGREAGFLSHYNGTAWTEAPGMPLDGAVYGVGGVSATEAYAVGAANILVEWDGAAWAPMNDVRVTGEHLTAIWGFDPGDLWAFGSRGTIIEYSAGSGSWTEMSGPTDNRIVAAWASSTSDIYAVGESGTVAHYNGVDWSLVSHGLTTAYLESIWGTEPNDVRIGAGNGRMLVYDGVDWQLSAVWDESYGPPRSLWGSAPDDFYAVHYYGAMRFDGTSWSKVELDDARVSAVHGVSAGEVYFLAGSGTPISAAGADETGTDKPRDGTDATQKAGPLSGTSTLIRYNGSGYTTVARDINAEMQRLWAASANNVYMLGRSGFDSVVGHYNGSGVTVKSAGVDTRLFGLFCTGSAAYAAGELGTVVKAAAR